MNRTLSVFFALSLLLISPATFADEAGSGGGNLSVRTFQFRYKEASKAATAIKSALSAAGSVAIQPAGNTLVVTDRPENLRNVAALLQQFDAPARKFKVSLCLVAASRVEAGAAKIPEDLKAVSAKLSGMLRFNSFESLGEISAEGAEGDDIVCELQSGYHATFHFGEYDPGSDSVRVADLQLSRLQPEAGESSELKPLLKTSLNLKVGQMVIMGAARDPQSQKALMIVLVAKKSS